MKVVWKSTSEEIGQVRVREPREIGLNLEPWELEALLARMFSCSTRRATPNEPRRSRTRCTRRTGEDWCQFGEHAAGGQRCVETKSG
jgi:hypothetical protein